MTWWRDQRGIECCLLACSHGLVSWLSYTTLDHPPRGDTANSVLDPSTSVTNPENTQVFVYRWSSTSIKILSSKLCQVCIESTKISWYTSPSENNKNRFKQKSHQIYEFFLHCAFFHVAIRFRFIQNVGLEACAGKRDPIIIEQRLWV